ncbi:MAG TPA: sigma-70 family RNA polymerase sigma factor [Pirellulales bacterium]|jgi:RNA polymerase sigma factor (sigma-70 family)
MAIPDDFMPAAENSIDSGSVTRWITQLRLGNSTAAQELWERYYARLIRLAHKRLAGVTLRAVDEEDVVQSAFASFCGRIEKGHFPRLHDRDDLWRLLVVITARKAVSQIRREKAQKRGGLTLSEPMNSEWPDLDAVVGNEPSPDFALQTAETIRDLLACLPLDSLRTLAQTKMEGLTNEEVARELRCSVRTVERRLQMIRDVWQSHDREE